MPKIPNPVDHFFFVCGPRRHGENLENELVGEVVEGCRGDGDGGGGHLGVGLEHFNLVSQINRDVSK